MEQPFDFRGSRSLTEVFNDATNFTFKRLQAEGVRPDKIKDLFYDALEEEGVDPQLKIDVADVLEQPVIDQTKGFIKQFIDRGGVSAIYSDPFRRMEDTYLSMAQNMGQEAIRLSKIRGAAADPFLLSIAREVSALPAEKHNDCAEMMLALVAGYEKAVNPPKRKPKPKHFRI